MFPPRRGLAPSAREARTPRSNRPETESETQSETQASSSSLDKPYRESRKQSLPLASRGCVERGALQRWPERLGAWGHARRPSTRRQEHQPSQPAGGSASPKGEARRECAGKAKRSACRAREDYGWGWAGGVTKPNHPPHPITPPPQHPRQREPFEAAPSAELPRRVPPRPRIHIHSIGEQLGMGSTAIGSSLAVGRLKVLGASGSQSRARPSRAVLRSYV